MDGPPRMNQEVQREIDNQTREFHEHFSQSLRRTPDDFEIDEDQQEQSQNCEEEKEKEGEKGKENISPKETWAPKKSSQYRKPDDEIASPNPSGQRYIF